MAMERAQSFIGRVRGDPSDKPLFDSVKYYLGPLLDKNLRYSLEQLLLANGAKNAVEASNGDTNMSPLPFEASTTTHVISNDTNFEGYNDALQNNIAVVTPQWVHAAIRNGHVHRPRFYSPDPAKFLSGLVVCTSGLTKHDREVVLGGAVAFGADYRNDLTVDVTHLITMAAEGKKYETVMDKSEIGIKAVLPQWLYDCVKFQRRIDEAEYVFPEPKLFERRTIITQDDENRPTPLPKGSSAKGYIHPYPLNEDILSSCAPTSPFMTGMRIYINPDTDISDAMRSVLEECINAAGARLLDKESTYSSENVDIYIGRWRFGEEYKQASIDGTIVGSIWWLSNTLARNRIESPTRTLLDYPLPKSGITEMQNMVITITNYSGVPRDYVRRLIHALGATYTPNLTEDNTHVVTSSQHGQKYLAGKQWNLDVVNHLWLEDCFQQWTCKSVAEEKYVYFPDTHVLEDLVGETTTLREEISRWWDLDLETPAEDVQMEENGFNRNSIIQTPSGDAAAGVGHVKIISKATRKAAINASNVLHDVMVPDMNAYKLELRSSPKRPRPESNEKTANGSAPSTPTGRKRQANNIILNREQTAESVDFDPSLDTEDAVMTTSNTKIARARPSGDKNNTQTDSQPTPSTPSKRRRQASSQSLSTANRTIRYVSSGLNPELTDSQKKQMNKLGAQWTDDIRDCTHLVVDKVSRTPKFICAINMGLQIVTSDWITASIKSGNLQEESDYQLHDTEGETKWEFSVSDSLNKARDSAVISKNRQVGTLLQGYDIHVTKNTEPSVSVLKTIVECAGGKVS
ncbi:regulator of Ty1 Transposition [Umbelopsis sp. WA50703]